jgi:SEC-C motif-containing protein
MCCEPYLTGVRHAPTAEALMRSRYAAFREGAAEYLFATHHPDSRSSDEVDDLRRSIAGTEWLNLLVLDARAGGVTDSDGHVEFAAAFRRKVSPLSMNAITSQIAQMHERSRFLREGGRWLYVDGEQMPTYHCKRNEPCWCGSGRKAKTCHS